MRSGGGKNVVNVILVDFRGYDTLGEITVLGIAVIGVLAMLASTPGVTLSGAARRSDALTHSPYAQPHLRSRLLRTSMSLILPLTLLFAGYVFFKGHNAPGGGFIAGLIASVALAVFRMSEGHAALRRLLPLKPATTVAIGLVVALGTGLVPMLLGYPLLTSGHWYIPLPGGDTFHLTSAMFFDTGVFIVVVGASVGIVNRLEEELE
jgi:multicomponent K+:H+ antiporter subunit A